MADMRSAEALFSVFMRMGQFCKRQQPAGSERMSELAVFGLLFSRQAETGSSRVRMTELSRYLMISKPAATQAVDRLVSQGLVARVNDPNDRRVVYAQATEKGQAEFQKRLNCMLERIAGVAARMEAGEPEELTRLMGRFLDLMIEENATAEEC